jgi:predicted PurR-regulated permease PerM
MKTTWSRPTKYLVAVGLVLLGIYTLHMSRSVIPLLIVAALNALIVRPVISWLHLRVHLSRGLAVGLVYLCLAILAPLVIILVLPTIIDALLYVGSLDYRSIFENGAEWLRSTLIQFKAVQFPVAGFDAYVDRAIDMVLEALQPISPIPAVPPSIDSVLQQLGSGLRAAVEAGANLVGAVFSQVATILFVFLASVYISLDAHTYRGTLLQALPAAYQAEISTLLARIERTWNAFFQGELTLMLVIGLITTIGLTALGMPGALYLGIIAGLLEIIPTIGPIIAAVPAAIVALVQGSTYLPISNLAFAGLVILFYILVQQVENNMIVPRVLGAAVDLPPLVVMTGAVVGASVGGILGVMLATPVIATGREILGYLYCKLLDREPLQIEDPVPGSGAPASPSGNWLSSLFRELQGWIRSRSSKSRLDSGEASHQRGKPGRGGHL